MRFVKPLRNTKLMSNNFKKDTHQYFMDDQEVPGVSRILREGGFTNYDDLLTIPGKKEQFEVAQKKGSDRHEVCRLNDINDLGVFDASLQPWLAGWQKFLATYKPTFRIIEKPLFSKRWSFAGTPDREGIINGQDILIDIKTGVKEPWHALQNAAYELLFVETYEIKIQERWTIQLLPNDYKIIPHNDISNKNVFLGAVQGYHWKANKGKLKGIN